MTIRHPPDAVPHQLLRRTRLMQTRAAILGILLHVPLTLGVVALLEGRFLVAAIGISLHLGLSLITPPAYVLAPFFPARFVAVIGRAFVSRSRWPFALLHLASLLLCAALGALLWAALGAG